MTTPDFDAIDQMLFSPGAPFEITTEEVLGEKMSVFKQRKRSLRELLESTSAHADDEYIVHGDRRITYGEHLRLVASTAQALKDRYGVGHGDRVAIFSENRPEWIIVYWATVSLGAIATALNGWWTRDEAAYGIEKTEPKVLIGDRKRLARLEGVDIACPILEIGQFVEKSAQFVILGLEPVLSELLDDGSGGLVMQRRHEAVGFFLDDRQRGG